MKAFLRTVLPVTATLLYPALAVWLFFQGNWYSFFHSYSLAMFFGLVSYCYLAVSLILGARLKALDLVFGHDRVIIFHSLIAAAGIIFGIFHAILKSVYFPEVTGQSIPGIIGLALFTLIALLTVMIMLHTPFDRIPPFSVLLSFVKRHFHVDYTILKAVHNITAPAFVLILGHVMLAYPVQETPGRTAFAGMSGILAILLYVYHKTVRPLRAFARAHRVSQVNRVSPGIVEITTVPKRGKAFRHKAGQFAFFRFLSRETGYGEHPFTISSGPAAGTLSITVKNLGNYTGNLGVLKPDTRCLIDGPYGLFYPKKPDSDLLFVAGGIGITPFLSILDDLAKTPSQRTVSLIWSVRYREEAFARNKLEALKSIMPGFSFRILVTGEPSFDSTSPDSRMDIPALHNAIQSFRDIPSAEAFICGPDLFRKSIQRQLMDTGFRKKLIHYEAFSF